jgi:F0F1-type ATP synthase assembly protein I
VSSSYAGGSVPPDYNSDFGGDGASAANQPPDVEDQSVGALVGRMTTHLSDLMRQELALAKAEIRAEAQKAAKGAGMLAGAGFAAWMVAVFASVTLMWLLDKAMDLWLAALIVTLLWGVVGAVLFVTGRNQLKQVNPKPEQTVESLKEDKEWLKAQKN